MYRLPDVQVVSLTQVKNTIMTLVSTAKVMVLSIALIAILIAVVGVVNTILMSVMERRQEIGILKAMGAMAADIFKLIWIETVILCVAGGIVGCVMALGTAKLTEVLIRRLLPYAPSGGLVRIEPGLVLFTLGVVTLIGLLSGDLSGLEGGQRPAPGVDPKRGGVMSELAKTVIEAEDLVRIYQRGSEEIRAVDGVSLSIEEGEFVAFIGPSGSGKTTLINILGCLDNPDLGAASPRRTARLRGVPGPLGGDPDRVRREVFGYIFQKFYLIPTLTVHRERDAAVHLLQEARGGGRGRQGPDILGIDNRKDHLPGRDLGRRDAARGHRPGPGQQARDPARRRADGEPRRAAERGDRRDPQGPEREEGLTIVLVTHNPDLAAHGPPGRSSSGTGASSADPAAPFYALTGFPRRQYNGRSLLPRRKE